VVNVRPADTSSIDSMNFVWSRSPPISLLYESPRYACFVARHESTLKPLLGLVYSGHFPRRLRDPALAIYGTNLYPELCTVRKWTGFAGSFSSFCRSFRMWLSTVRVDG